MRHMLGLMIGLAVAATLGAQTMAEQAKAELKNVSGQVVGNATLTETPHGVLIHVELTNAPQGTHAFHVHQTGKCEPPFTSAGGHFNPASKQHGFENPMGMHAGDLPNIQIPAGGRLTFEMFHPDLTLKPGPNSLLDADGSALIIHQGVDDYKTDPTGGAGDRVACGVVTK